MSAYFHAYYMASKYDGHKVEILLETGTHFITSAHMESFFKYMEKNKDADFSNPTFDLII